MESRKKDVTGERFNMLTAIEPTGNSNSDGVIWRWQCDCGKTIESPINVITSGGKKSCGCDRVRLNAKQAIEMQKHCLRIEGTNVNNISNDTIYQSNTSGVRGVSWHKGQNKWQARIGFKGKTILLGYFDDIEDAKAARKEAEEEYFKAFIQKLDDEAQ